MTRFLTILAVWTVLGCAGALQLIAANHAKASFLDVPLVVNEGRFFASQLVAWWFWIPVTYLVVWLAPRRPLDVGTWPTRARAVALHVLVAIPIAVAHGLLYQHLDRFASGYRPPQSLVYLYYAGTTFFTVLFDIVVYAAIVAVVTTRCYAIRFRDRDLRAAELERQLADARLRSLRMQLHPHFLFNALNVVAHLIRRDDKRQAIEVVVGFSELLRQSLDSSDEQDVPLSRELAFITRYLEIERIRFADRLHTRVDVEPELDHVLVPQFVVQPLVENALRHGVADEEGEIDVLVRATEEDGTLIITVEDSGPGISRSAASGAGVGLANTRERLRQLYGVEASVRLCDRPGGGAIAELRLPIRGAVVPRGLVQV